MPQIQIGKQPATQITIIEAEPEKQAEALAIMTERARGPCAPRHSRGRNRSASVAIFFRELRS
jgi:hypothetical protein